MRKVFYFGLVFLIGIAASVNAQVNIGSQKDAHSGALLELDASSAKKGLLLPRIAIADVNAWGLAGDPVAGMVVFNTDDNKVYVWNGEKWAQMGEGQTTPVVVPVTGVSVTPAAETLDLIGATLQLTATVAPSNATNQNVSWSSSDESVVTVSPAGLVTAVANGQTIVTATTEDGGETATSIIVVNAPVAVTGVSVTPTAVELTEIGAMEQLVATVLPENATNKNVTWSSSDENVATVDATGLVTAVANGEAIIKVKTVDGGIEATANVTVSTASEPVEFRVTQCTYWGGVADYFLGAPGGPGSNTITVHVQGEGDITYQWYAITGYGWGGENYPIVEGKTSNSITVSVASDKTGDLWVPEAHSCSWVHCYCIVTQNIGGEIKTIRTGIFGIFGSGMVCPA